MNFNYKTYPSPSSLSVIFFAAPFGIKIRQLRWTIKSLQKAGYTVVAYDTDREVVTSAQPELLADTINKIRDDIHDQIKAYRSGGIDDFGFFGSSLGAFIMYNCVAQIRQLRWGVLNTGGDAAHAVWKKSDLRQIHEASGISLDSLTKAWHKLQYPKLSHMRGKHIMFISSNNDRILPRAEIDKYIEPIRAAGAHVDLLELNIWGHNLTVIFGLLHAKKLINKVHGAHAAQA